MTWAPLGLTPAGAQRASGEVGSFRVGSVPLPGSRRVSGRPRLFATAFGFLGGSSPGTVSKPDAILRAAALKGKEGRQLSLSGARSGHARSAYQSLQKQVTAWTVSGTKEVT
jgi:hypothetical protein|uniref:Uncharacterized protein n=1 Tax=Mus musculus TaxID=10090 RepID=Q8BGL5_MOUSE|nr:unnamed protein product [Mus musculus]BAC38849.1 unnamed protein product [Mus musculus]